MRRESGGKCGKRDSGRAVDSPVAPKPKLSTAQVTTGGRWGALRVRRGRATGRCPHFRGGIFNLVEMLEIYPACE